MATFWQDIRYGLRMLWKNPGFTVIAVLTLALGIGANTALFSVVNGVLLNPLSYPEPHQLVAVYSKTAEFEQSSISYPNFLDWEKNNRTFASLAAFRNDDFNVTGQGEPERLRGYMISADFFPMLGVKPVIGRTFRREEDQAGAGPVALISAGLWKRKFGLSADVLQKTMLLNGTGYSLIGVIPASFRLYGEADVFVPIGQWNDPTFRDRRVSMGMNAIGRLKPGATLEQARSDMASVAKSLADAYPEADAKTGITLLPLKTDMVGDIGLYLFVLLGAVAFVLLIACANVANLLLARATGRTREFGIRIALGASQGRVVRQLLTESVLLSLTGGLLGLLLAWQGTRAVLAALPRALPRASEISIDARVLVFTLAISVLGGIIFGMAPAVRTWRTNLQDILKEGGRGTSAGRHRAQSIFVAVEMAMALVLVVGAGLMIRSLALLWSVNPGFNSHNVLTLSVALPPSLGDDPAKIRATLRELHDQMKAIPGVEAVSITGGSLPMTGDSELPFWLDGQPKPATNQEMNVSLFYLVEADYLKAMGIPLQRGRFFTERDNEGAPKVIVIDESLARKFFPNQDPIGKRLNLELIGNQVEIVGVVGHVKHWGLDSEGHEFIQSQFYIPFMQIPDKFMPLVAHGVSVTLRSQAAPLSLVSDVRRVVTRINNQQVVYDIRTMEGIVSDSLAARRFSMVLLGVFAALALILSSIGIYGVISYLVGQRTQEIGIRMALGAQQSDVMRLVVGQGAKMALAGVAIGLVFALWLMRFMVKMLYGISTRDPLTFAGVALLLLVVALAACYIPARRAMRVDLVDALRYE
jgi:predicted permease